MLELEAETYSSCSACDVKSGCGTSVLAKWVGKKFTRFNARNTINAEVGDQVIVGLSEHALMTGSLAVYLWPLLGMIVFALVSDTVILQDAAYRDQIVALSGFAGFMFLLGLSRYFLNREGLKQQLTPTVLRKVIGENYIGKIPES